MSKAVRKGRVTASSKTSLTVGSIYLAIYLHNIFIVNGWALFAKTAQTMSIDHLHLHRKTYLFWKYIFLVWMKIIIYFSQGNIINIVLTWSSLVAQTVKNLPAIKETQVWSLGQEDPLEKGMATHSSILAWRIPWTEEPGGLQSVGLQNRT